MTAAQDSWSGAEAYERYMGRWSRLVAREFLAWLDLPLDLEWVDVGCGTGALTARIMATAQPRRVRAYDLSLQYVMAARQNVPDPGVCFAQANALSLPERDGAFDVAVSGLMLNFVAEPARLIDEMRRVVKPGGTVGVYVWDYAEGMQFIRQFWDAAVALNPAAAALDEGARFPVCRPDRLRLLFTEGGLDGARVHPLEIPTRFESIDDYWEPFEGGQGPAPGYLASLDEKRRGELRAAVAARLPRSPDGSVSLVARAWGARGLRVT